MSTAKPSLAPCSARKAGEPARFLPKWKSKPMAAPPMPKRPTRMRAMKSSADVPASAPSNVMTKAPSSPVAASRRSLSRSLDSWNSVSCGRRNRRGCGVKVKCRGLAPERLRALLRCSDDGTMTAVHAVEIADRHHGAMQRAGVDLGAWPARDMKGASFRFRGFAQRLLLILRA